ncbi:MAG: hypothetical protein ACRCVT_05180 [Leadbetterella sp.]
MNKLIYKKLFDVNIQNSYYENGKFASGNSSESSSDFLVFPSEFTTSLLKEYGWVFKSKSNSCNVMAKVKEEVPLVYSMARMINSKEKLTFFLKLKNPNVPSFSEVSASKLLNNKVYYFNNLKNNTDARNDLRLSLQDSVKEQDMMVVRPSYFTFEHNQSILASEVKIASLDTNLPALGKVWASHSNGKTNLKIDISNLAEGRYQFVISGSIVEEFYFLKNDENVFGVVELYFAGTEDNYKIVENDNTIRNIRPQYRIRLDRRKAFWRFVLNMSTNSLVSPNLETSDNSIQFLMTSPSSKQRVFTSSALVDSVENPLVQFSPNFRVMLKDGGIEKRPSVPMPKIIKEERNQIYLETIINI